MKSLTSLTRATICLTLFLAWAGYAPEVKAQSLKAAPASGTASVTYEEAFVDLHQTLGRQYPCFALKNIDWPAVGEELLPRAKRVKTDGEFGLLCMELVARIEDSHAYLLSSSANVPAPAFARWDPGFACLIDDGGKPVVYYVDRGGPAAKAGVKIGMTVVSVDGRPAVEAIEDCRKQVRKHQGFSSERYLRYQVARWFVRQMERGTIVSLEMTDPAGKLRKFELPATMGVRYLPRLPAPIPGIRDSANVAWTRFDENIGYIYVRRIKSDLIESLDKAVGELQGVTGLIVDVRGNSGGGYDARRAHRNFAPDDSAETERPRFAGPIALLIDSRCISAGEGWASWFVANNRAKLLGEATAGASARKRTYALKNGLYQVKFPVKAYCGSLDRPIERRGLEPDVPLRQNAQDLAAGRDTVLEAAKKLLLKKQDN
ncbi:S41 family peptidase [Candidatus Sumerlaeota bacterium]